MNQLYLNKLDENDITEEYVSWLNDKEVNQFLECRFKHHTIESEKEYLKNMDNNNIVLAITTIDNKIIGNISFKMIDMIHHFAYISVMIGNKDYWRKGYGVNAIRAGSEFAYNHNIRKLIAGIYQPNEASFNAFRKAGYCVCGMYKDHRIYEGKYVYEILMEKLVGQDDLINV